VSEMTRQSEAVFAVEVDSGLDLSNLADYRHLKASQRSAVAAELKRTIEIEERRSPSRLRRRTLLRVKPATIMVTVLGFMRSLCAGGLDQTPGHPDSSRSDTSV
jgi:hypothetical protein